MKPAATIIITESRAVPGKTTKQTLGNSSRFGFTLIEIMVSLTVIALIFASLGGVLVSIQRSWQKQRDMIDILQDVRQAAGFMTNEIRSTNSNANVVGGNMWFELNPGGPANRVWYWRGDDAALGTIDIIYRGIGAAIGNANTNRQEIVNFIVNNPSGNPIFQVHPADNNLYIIELSVQKNDQFYTLTTQVRARNN